MEELTKDEFLFLKWIDEHVGLSIKGGIEIEASLNAIYRHSVKLFLRIQNSMKTIIEKEIVDTSPDGSRFKLTEFGDQLYRKKIREQEEWINQGPFIKLNPGKRDEIDIKQGEHFKGAWEVIGILKRAKRIVKLQDAYLGVEILAILNELDVAIDIEILTSDKWKHKELFAPLAQKLKESRKGKIEIRVNNSIHSRRLIVDDLEVYGSDDSFKDIGLHSSAKITRLAQIEGEVTNFDKAWSEAEDFKL